MFRALLFPTNAQQLSMDAPLSVTLLEKDPARFGRVDLALTLDGIFTTAVGHSSKRTLASWHVTSPEAIVDSMLHLVKGDLAAQ
jgi:trehalose 6-phosphate synthase/phosphatase